MTPAQIIAAKRDGRELSDAEIAFFIDGFARDAIPDYQMSALAMAIFLNGMSDQETATLTAEMLNSGTRLAWPDDGIPRVDKHSTGGVGDKVSIPLAPLLAACGLQVPMLSGRGLGPTGGTLDKLESIHGFRTDLNLEEILRTTQECGCVITGASAELAPADRRLYALRDVTGTVPSIPLITASIMSKKLAESTDALVLDVKFGSGAFMKTRERAKALAESLVRTGQRMGVPTTALLTDMNQPLGRKCGNALEIQESVDILRGQGPNDVRHLTLELAAELLFAVAAAESVEHGRRIATNQLDSGAAYEVFERMVSAQGGDLSVDAKVADAWDVVAPSEGIIQSIDTEQLGLLIINMGGGRRKMTDLIDHSVGLEMLTRVGQSVSAGEPIVRLYGERSDTHAEAVLRAIGIGESGSPLPLLVDRISG